MSYLFALLACFAIALALGRRSPAQAEPRFDHAGLRWRILHGERFGTANAVVVVIVLAVLWGSWIEILAILWVLGGRNLGWWMIDGPALANLVALVAIPVLLRSWTEIDADPSRLVIRRLWGRREIPWAAVSEVKATRKTLTIVTDRALYHLDAPQASAAAVAAVARWIEDGRRSPVPPAPPAEPAPPEIVELVSRAGARSAQRAGGE